MGLSDVCDSFKTLDGNGDGTYNVVRPGVQVRAAGVVSAGAITSFTNVVMSVQPVSGKDLKTLPEGRRREDVRQIYTAFVLQLKDVVTIAGEDYEVYHVAGPWDLGGDIHVEASAAKRST